LTASSHNGGNGEHIPTNAGNTDVKNGALLSLGSIDNKVIDTLKHNFATLKDFVIEYC
jgi:hypothetical protein